MIASSRLYLARAPWTVFCPGLALALVVLAVNLVGDGLRDRLDPRLARRLCGAGKKFNRMCPSSSNARTS